MSETPRAGETWERVRDGERMEVMPATTSKRVVLASNGGLYAWTYNIDFFRREFRRVEP